MMEEQYVFEEGKSTEKEIKPSDKVESREDGETETALKILLGEEK